MLKDEFRGQFFLNFIEMTIISSHIKNFLELEKAVLFVERAGKLLKEYGTCFGQYPNEKLLFSHYKRWEILLRYDFIYKILHYLATF